MKIPILRAIGLFLLASAATLHAQVPQIINYQGRVAVGTTNFDGSGSFQFALVNGAGTTTYWSNSPDTTPADGVPDSAVSLTVTKGLYSVLLGDTTLANMTAIPNSVFANSDVRLRVWFNDGTNGSQLLTPDQRLAAVGYAMVAGGVPDGSITAAKIAAGAVGTSQLASNLSLSGTITGSFSGPLNGNATTATTAGSATNFTGSLEGNVTGTQGATVVATVGGVTAANVAAGANLANAATNENTPNTIVKRDASGTIPASAVATAPPGMALIPAGTFTMGNSIGDAEITDATPIKTTVSAFYMDVNLVSLSQWQAVKTYADANSYIFTNAGSGKAASHPVQSVNWWDCVKWCNARSQQAGRTPAYYTDAGLTTVYMTGEPATVYVDWVVSGYRLPTEAEWEKAARGGRSNQRFPRGNTISQSQANYYGATGYAYDLSPINDFHPTYATGGFPYTSPVGSFAANGYGLYDMAGNVFQWCWDWYGTPYAGGSDPYGPVSGSGRVIRGGSWDFSANNARCASRFNYNPIDAYSFIGFRSVLPPGQP